MTQNYHSYKRIDPVYFSGEIFFPIGLLFVAALISYGLLYIAGLGLALFFNVVIAWCSYFYLHYYGKSSAHITFEFLMGFFTVLALLLFVDYGVYALVTYQKTGFFNGLYFLIWSVILFGSPTVYYIHYFGSNYNARIRLAKTYFKASFGVYHDRELLTYIDSIAFVNSSKKLMSDIKLENNIPFYSDKELAKMEISSKYQNLNQSVFSSLINIPFGTDQFQMSWYSIIEDKYYTLKVPFPSDKLILEEEKYPMDESKTLRGQKSKRMYLHIYQNGGIKLYNEDVILLDYPGNVSVEISAEEKEKKITNHRRNHTYYNDEHNFSQLIEKIKQSGNIEERFKLRNELLNWDVNFSGLGERNYIEIEDLDLKKYKIRDDSPLQSGLKYLPKKVIFVYRGSYLLPWLTVHINTQKLYRIIQENTLNKEDLVSLVLAFEDHSGQELAFYIHINEKKILFADWEIQIDVYRKKDMEEQQIEKREDDEKRRLLKEGWDFVFAKNYESAQKNCDAIFALDPKYAYAYFMEARIVWYTKGFEICYAKRDYYFEKTAHEPLAQALIYNSYGCILDVELRYEESLPYFEKAIEISPKEPIYVCNLGEIYYKLKDPAKAIQYARKAKKMGYESAMLSEILTNKGIIDLINH